MPGHTVKPIEGRRSGAVAGAPYGNAGVLPIAYSYIKMSGKDGLLGTAQQAILNANYMMNRLEGHFIIKYKGE